MAPRPTIQTWSANRKYGIVIDAGSSGSRVQVYSWLDPELVLSLKKQGKQSADNLSKVEKGVEEGDGWHFKVEPGISTYGDKPEAVGTYLRPLIEFAASVIPTSQHEETPIYLLATAGMRLLPLAQQERVLAETCTYLKQSYSFNVGSCKDNIRVITGEEEGLYGWIAVNYLMDGFDKHEHAQKGEVHSSTYGFLDMGGASTQIAFEPSESERKKHADNLLEVKMKLLSGKEVTHPVFVTTFLGFGTNQARSRYVDQEIKAFLKSSDEEHKSFPTTYEPSTSTTNILVDDPCLPKSLMLSEPRHAGYTFRGTGSFAGCVSKTGPLLNKEVECLDLPCLFNGVHVPTIDFSVNHFIGISEYWYSTQDVWTMGNIYDFVEFEKNAIHYCGRQWNDIMDDHDKGSKWKSSIELSRLEQQCFKAAWIVNILHEGIGIPRIIDKGGEGTGSKSGEKGMGKAKEKGLVDAKKRPPSFQSLNQVNNIAISWTLGKMVLEVAQGSTSAGKFPTPSDPTTITSSSTESHSSNSATLDWSDRMPSWSENFTTTISKVPTFDPLAYVGIAFIIGFLYHFFLSSTALRRRKSLIGGLFGSKRRNEFGLVGDDSGDSSSDSRSPPRSSGRRTSITTPASLYAQVLYGIFRASSVLKRWSRPTPSASPFAVRAPLLPAGFNTRSNEPVAPPPRRPSGMRQTNSTPVFSRPTPRTSNFYNDAPDVSDRVRNGVAPKSSLYLDFRNESLPPPIIPFSNYSPPTEPIGLSSSRPNSRPTTPSFSLTSPSTQLLQPRTRENSEEGSFIGARSTPPITMGEDGDPIPRIHGSPSAISIGNGLGAGARLRSSLSREGSATSLVALANRKTSSFN